MKAAKPRLVTLGLACIAVCALWRRSNVQSKNSIGPQKEAALQCWSPEEKRHFRWEKWYWVASIFLTLFAGIGAALSARYAYQAAYQALVANNMNAESGRAWLGMKSIAVTEPLISGLPVSLFVSYANYGREPAQETGFLMEYHSFSKKEWSDGTAASILQAAGTQCFSLSPQNTAGISFPSNSTNSGYGLNLSTDDETIPPGSRLVVDDELMRGNQIFTMSGCLIYKTVGKIRHTSFCYHYQAGDSKTPGPRYCTIGNDAD